MYNYMVKKRNQKGFTLMEMLIVVAIIAILVAISIPIFTSQLGKARKATDEANERAAKAVVVAMYLNDEITFSADDITLYYDAENGKAVTSNNITEGYGKTTGNKDKVVSIKISKDGSITTGWDDHAE